MSSWQYRLENIPRLSSLLHKGPELIKAKVSPDLLEDCRTHLKDSTHAFTAESDDACLNGFAEVVMQYA